MAARVYVCPIVGTGTGADPYRPLVRDKAGVISTSACIDHFPTGINRGQPKLNWSICWVEATSFTAIDNDNNCLNVFDYISSLDSAVGSGKLTFLVGKGYITQVEANAVITWRDLLRLLVQKHYSYTDEKAVVL